MIGKRRGYHFCILPVILVFSFLVHPAGLSNRGLTHAAAIAGTILVLSPNALLVLQSFGVAMPELPGAG